MSGEEDQNIFLVIREDIKNVSIQVQDVDDKASDSNASLVEIENSIKAFPFDSLAAQLNVINTGVQTTNTSISQANAQLNTLQKNVDDKLTSLGTSVQGVSAKVDAGVASLASQFTATNTKIDGVGTKVDSGVQTTSAQLTAFQKDTNSKIDTLGTSVASISTQLTAFQNSTRASLDNITALLNAIIKILKPLGLL
ncbi:ORF-122 peptide [Chrysodeixis chalcites nucleopolyhedrovirus]|uniref:ORF-122 peptide n=1 Tax=Chrysodeixis chalcites nucleopolyhedrovirus TaxID=320432 RepID=Q4KSW8_9ABAC|nr:ORF-122 peptide [Chrysodeixis chalcites nucleopolyhedrovirus]AAY84043.1 ORF-122 peptide [Chrysodeixis chalcites nucleopolyhedrovirus]AGC36326.1 hypothetical protein TF1A_00112 [Chrysodeixis chalcites SNPV TF1-A]AGE61518.1 hypothetical protein [Chrysodeixis chalcites nucleopolyhedrovirus]AGE61672.1 hypothetical protein [Chrysodeixis chalcites nucleopolyhedrovirus]